MKIHTLSIAFVAIVYLFIQGPVFAASSFESGWDNFYQTVNANNIPPNWGTYFKRKSGGTTSGGTGPSSGAEGSNYYIYFESSNGEGFDANDTAILKTGVNWNQHVQYAGQMEFYYHMFGADIGTLSVEVNVQSSGSWQEIWSIAGQQHYSNSAAWTKKMLNLDLFRASLGDFYSVRFKVLAAGGYKGDIALDLVNFTSSGAQESKVFRYDALGRVVCVVDKRNGDRAFAYDDAGNRDAVTVGVDCGE
jgi:YD repeat-containing protein